MKLKAYGVIAAVLAFIDLMPKPAPAQVAGLSTDCRLGRYDPVSGAYQFVATCPGRAVSPDGRFAIVQRRYEDDQPPIELQDAKGRALASLPTLSDDMPFAVFWSPDAHWIAVNHHVGSFMDQLQIFEIVGHRVIERTQLVQAAKRISRKRYPCLSLASVLSNAVRWFKDGHRLIIVTISSPSACRNAGKPGSWSPLWMIGDVSTGGIDPASIRVDKGNGAFIEPRDVLYRRS